MIITFIISFVCSSIWIAIYIYWSGIIICTRYFNNNDFSSNILKYKSQKISHNNNINGLELEKPYEISNLKPVGGRRPGAGLKAIGYEPNRKSIFDDLNFGGGFGLNKKKETNNNKFG